MKKLSILFISAFMGLALNASAQKEETRKVSDFNGIMSSASFSVHVKIDGTETLKIVADEKIIDDIETVVEGSKLHIGFKNKMNWESHQNVGKVDIYVTAKSLSSLSNSGSGSIKVEGELTGSNGDVHISGSGNITTAVKTSSLNIHISGSGSVNLNGNSNTADVHISGSGALRGKELKTENLNVSLSGSGSAHINADHKISGHISGSGSLVYSGSANDIDIRSSGSGRVRKES